ncbi:hypothetical protein SAMN04488036_1101, partial [Shimia haliotis]
MSDENTWMDEKSRPLFWGREVFCRYQSPTVLVILSMTCSREKL